MHTNRSEESGLCPPHENSVKKGAPKVARKERLRHIESVAVSDRKNIHEGRDDVGCGDGGCCGDALIETGGT